MKRHAHHGAVRLALLVGAGWFSVAPVVAFAQRDVPVKTAGAETLDDIVVTAQKRVERLVDAPLSITALQGEFLDRSTAEGTTEALSRVPGVSTTVSFQGGGTQISIRGVSAAGPLFNGSSPIAYYLDSVPFGLVKTALAPDSSTYDLDRVEVLRGPQGTLYGASAQNGVVRVLTKDPNLTSFEFKARAGLSSTDGGGENYRGDMAVNVPVLSDRLAVRLVAGYQDLSGWIDRPNKKDANDAELLNLRGKVAIRPVEDLSIDLIGAISRADYGAPNLSADGRRNRITSDEAIHTDYDLAGIKVGYDFPAFSVSNSTSWLDYRSDSNLDLDALTAAGTLILFSGLDARVFSNDFLLSSSEESAWRWNLGVFYRNAKDSLFQNNLGGGVPFDYSNFSESYAIYGELGRRFLDDKFEVTLGLRYFHDRVQVLENQSQAPPAPAIDIRSTFKATTPRVVLTYHPAKSSTIYASYSQGFRSGFPQDPGVLRADPNFPSLRPDRLHNYELGAKAEAFDRKLYVEGAVYYIDWKNVQQPLTVATMGTNITALLNGESASGFGAEFLASIRPAPGFDLSANVSWNDLQLDKDVFSSGTLLFAKGDRLTLSPKLTLGASANYRFDIGQDGNRGRLSASVNHVSRQSQRTIYLGAQRIGTSDPITTVAASAGIDLASGWSLTAFVDNLTDERSAALRQNFPAPEWSVRIRPRTIGLQAEIKL